METRALERMRDDADVSPILASLRCGESSIFDAIHEELPEVFTAEILNRLDLRSTLNLAQVSKSYRDAVWSVDGMRSLGEKVKPFVFGKRAGLPISSMGLDVTHGNLPSIRARVEYFWGRGPRCFPREVEDELPVRETITVDAAHQAYVRGLIEAIENEIVTELNQEGSDEA
jgi:hypothetical protein